MRHVSVTWQKQGSPAEPARTGHMLLHTMLTCCLCAWQPCHGSAGSGCRPMPAVNKYALPARTLAAAKGRTHMRHAVWFCHRSNGLAHYCYPFLLRTLSSSSQHTTATQAHTKARSTLPLPWTLDPLLVLAYVRTLLSSTHTPLSPHRSSHPLNSEPCGLAHPARRSAAEPNPRRVPTAAGRACLRHMGRNDPPCTRPCPNNALEDVSVPVGGLPACSSLGAPGRPALAAHATATTTSYHRHRPPGPGAAA